MVMNTSTLAHRCRQRASTPSQGDLSATLQAGPRRRRGPPLQPDDELVAAIGALVANQPTYGYLRVHALLHREAEATRRAAPNLKRVNPVRRLHGHRRVKLSGFAVLDRRAIADG
ncbi:hypothetical protein GCM10007973_27430 [Polymorphobacter multimanifer]|nr:hypothetical protein GCM10007973_27430 [Polymorphobacter multimanifer]